MIALAGDVSTMIVGRCIQGIAFGGLHISCIMVAEYAHPKRRGFFIVFKIAAVCLGELICHGLGAVLTWRQIAWVGSVPAALCAIGTVKWNESPAWFAFKGRYEECAAAFEQIRGKDREARSELKELISAQQKIREMNKSGYDDTLLATFNAFRCKEFLKPLFILSVSTVLLQACGTYFIPPHLTQIMVSMTGDSSLGFYFTLTFDLMKIFAILLSSVIVWRFHRRIILFTSGSLAFLVLALMCILDYLNRKGLIDVNWLTPSTLVIYFFLICMGVVPITVVNKGELLPLEYRGIGACTTGILFAVLTMVTLKMTSKMIMVLDVYGTFAIYLVICVAMLTIMYFVMPETKDRTMQNIESDFINIKLTHKDDDSVSDIIGSLVLLKSTSSSNLNRVIDNSKHDISK